MSDDHINRVKRPRSKDISTWFSRKSDQPSSCSSSQASISTPIAIEVTEEPSSESALPSSVRNEFDPLVKRTTKEVEHNRLRLKAAIEAVRLLADQGQAFRGHDESESSLNAGNFKQVKKSYERMASDDDRLILQNGPENAKYTCPSVQKQLLNILGNKVRKMICEELGDAKFCILVDEAVDAAGKEQMFIVLRFVDRQGFIRERIFKIVSVPNTTSFTLKLAIVEVLGMFDLQVSNMRGQGYDGASNMSGIWNGLQALFLEDCPYAYYVHCFAHRLQLALNGAAKGVHDTCRFFSTLLLVVNFVDSSAKRKGALKAAREDEIQDLIALNTLQTGGACCYLLELSFSLD